LIPIGREKGDTSLRRGSTVEEKEISHEKKTCPMESRGGEKKELLGRKRKALPVRKKSCEGTRTRAFLRESNTQTRKGGREIASRRPSEEKKLRAEKEGDDKEEGGATPPK